jgi:ABC-type nickel/cobalt efflux system permease component RcnA
MVPGAATLTFPAGQGGLHTSRLELRLAVVGVALSNRPVRLTYATTFAIDRVGWREIVVVRAVGSAITATTASTSDRTDALHSYPADLLASPLDQRTATIDARIGDGGIRLAGLDTEGNVAAGVAGKDASGFAGLLDEHRRLSLGVVLGSLLVALGFGMLHALSPGHGKSMVAAYLAGTRGTARHAFALGATVTIAHTSSVFALGLVTLTLSELIVPDRLYPWLDLTSGVMVLTLGAIAIRGRLRWRSRQVPHAVARQHEHGHSHDPAGHGHSHGTADPAGLSWRSLIALGVSGGLIPCPSALVVLLSAIAAHRLAFGMVLIVAFSFGLAAVISGVGLAVLYARRLFARVPSGGRLLALLPVASAVAITILGLVLTVRALPRLV